MQCFGFQPIFLSLAFCPTTIACYFSRSLLIPSTWIAPGFEEAPNFEKMEPWTRDQTNFSRKCVNVQCRLERVRYCGPWARATLNPKLCLLHAVALAPKIYGLHGRWWWAQITHHPALPISLSAWQPVETSCHTTLSRGIPWESPCVTKATTECMNRRKNDWLDLCHIRKPLLHTACLPT